MNAGRRTKMMIKIVGLFLLTVLAFTIGYVVGRCVEDDG